MARRFILAEYCEGPFYMGWWLYLRERNDGSRNKNDGFDCWGWLRCRCSPHGSCICALRKVFDLLKRWGFDPPEPKRHSQDLAEWFAANFPNGLSVRIQDGVFCDPQDPGRRPKQVNRGVIRTIARAKKSFNKACAEVDRG